MKMDVTSSDEELDFIKRPLPRITFSYKEDEERPATPPMDHSTNLSKSLGLVLTPQSPPYRRIRSLKLVESPNSFLKCRFGHPITSTPSHPVITSTPTAHGRNKRSRLNHLNLSEHDNSSLSNGNSPSAYINPFTIEGRNTSESRIKYRLRRTNVKRCSFKSEDSLGQDTTEEREDVFADHKRPRLSDFKTNKYLEEDFIVLEVIGTGVHGCVYKCLNKLNGMKYAVKRGVKQLNNEKMLHNEIYAHGVLEHPNIIRNYSSWREDDYIYLQNEYCNGGSLEKVIEMGPSDEKTLRKMLRHIAQGLWFIHSKQLAHMDIKPENILISKGPRVFHKVFDPDEYMDDDDPNEESVYKIGDLGHVTRLDEIVDVVEGDCRYIPREILNDDYTNLSKVDIFALGLTLYEAAGGGPLPKNGDEWHTIRDGHIKTFENLSFEFNYLLKRMIHVNPSLRPTASELLTLTTLSSTEKTEKQELKLAKQKILLLEQQIQDAMKYFKVVRSQGVEKKRNKNNNELSCANNNRMVGKKSRRSHSTTSF